MEDVHSATEAETAKPPPPYISFRTLLNLIERLADEGIPRKIDRSVLQNLSGGYQGQVLAALRWLDLIDEDGRIQESFVGLVQNPEERKQRIGAIVRQRYPQIIALGERNATQSELEEELRKTGIGGATLRKATSFFLHASTFGEVPVSPFFKATAAQDKSKSSQGRRPRAKGKKYTTDSSASTTEHTTGTEEELRRRYVEMLLKKADEQEEMDENLLDRIEVLLGYRNSQNGRKEEAGDELHAS